MNGLSGGSLRWPLDRALPVEVVAPPGRCRRRARGPRSLATGEAEPRRRHQRLLRAGDDHVHAPLVLRQLDRRRARRPRRRRSAAPWRCATSVSARTSFTTPVEVSEKVVKTSSTPGFSASSAVELGRIDLARPTRSRSGWSRRRRPRTARPSARRTCRTTRRGPARPGARGSRRRTPAPRCPSAVKTSTSFWVWNTFLQALQHARVDLDEGRRAVVDHRLGHHLGHARRQRRRAGGHQVLLDVGIRHERPRIASARRWSACHGADGR